MARLHNLVLVHQNFSPSPLFLFIYLFIFIIKKYWIVTTKKRWLVSPLLFHFTASSKVANTPFSALLWKPPTPSSSFNWNSPGKFSYVCDCSRGFDCLRDVFVVWAVDLARVWRIITTGRGRSAVFPRPSIRIPNLMRLRSLRKPFPVCFIIKSEVCYLLRYLNGIYLSGAVLLFRGSRG